MMTRDLLGETGIPMTTVDGEDRRVTDAMTPTLADPSPDAV